ncbi:MAG: methionine gamma-lyase family protein [Lachnospiraceae bacterium]|nr:methionine gamma-lyase family protein [Lachnospiraceae bacterium]
MKTNEYLKENFNIDEDIISFCHERENEIRHSFDRIDDNAELNQLKVISAMHKNRVSDVHFAATTGYGYNDLGRDTLEKVYADIFKAEEAIVRPQLISGTNALYIALSGNLRPGDEILSPAGAPYDTLQGVIGIRKERGSLSEFGITYKQVDLLENGDFDYGEIKNAINERTKLVIIQRSKGYEMRDSFTIERLFELISFIKSINKRLICMVDNCYGEFVETKEPIEAGADMVVGSLIKNPGGGLAQVGGYIAGKEEYIENAANRLTAPGLGREVGPSLGIMPALYQGIFMAPQIVAGSLKGAVFASKVFEKLGYKTLPKSTDKRADIVQSIELGSESKIIAFCRGIQKAAPVDSFVTPEPWDMPGYDCKVIMAAGAFVQGSSIELSADAPIKPPYNVFVQGGLSWHHAKLGILQGLQEMRNDGLLDI